MELYELKNVFDAGGLVSATVSKAVLDKRFILIFKTKSNSSVVMTSQRESTPRLFKTIDAAVTNAHKIGFKQVTVDLS